MNFILNLLFFINILDIKNFDTNTYSVSISDEYTFSTGSNNTNTWKKNNDYISISVSNNSNNLNFKNYDKKNMTELKKYIEGNINNQIDNVDVIVSNIQTYQLNDYYVVDYNIYWPSKDIIGYDIYQHSNIMSSKNYIYTLTYSKDTDDIYNDEYNSFLKSFKIKDDLINDTNYTNYFLAFGLILIFTLSLIPIIRRKSK